MGNQDFLFGDHQLFLQAQTQRYQELCGRVRSCTNCGLHQEVKTRGRTPIVGFGPVADVSLYILCAAPSAKDEERGEIMEEKSRARIFLQTFLTQSQVAHVYYGSLVRCHLKGRAPTEEEVRACLPFVEAELQLVRPKVILGLGALVGQYLTEGTSNNAQRYRGTWFSWKGNEALGSDKQSKKKKIDAPIRITHSPFLVLNEGNEKTKAGLLHDLTEDFQAVRDMISLVRNTEKIK